MRRRTLFLVALMGLVVAPQALAGPVTGGSNVPAPVGDATGVCDPIDPAHCLLPFPSDFFTVADATTATGRRVNLSPLALPTNVAGKPWDPTEWNRNDGFSPGAPILTRVPGLDLHTTWGIAGDQLSDLARSLRSDAPMVLLDAATGERHPFWSELDHHPDTTDADRLLIIRPARNLVEGHRYLVALRNLKDGSGTPIAAQAPFATLRDGAAAPPESPGLDARRPAIDRVLDELGAAGVSRDGLYLAWDFTVASERNLTERVLAMRDDAFARLGDTDLANGLVEGSAPHVTIGEVVDRAPAENRGTARTVTGTVTVPNYLTQQVETSASMPAEAAAAVEPVTDQLPDLPDPLGEAVGLATDESLPVAVPGARLFYGADGLPEVNPAQPTVEVPFECHVPHRANVPNADGRADAMLYGHGLLGGRGESGGSSTEDLRLRGFMPCAVDWLGMATSDLANVASILADMSNFPSLPDRAQQGFVNFLYLGRALAHPDGLAAQAALQDASGTPLFRTGSITYDGNSQGGIMGGALTALAPDFSKAKLGVPAMNYSTLLNRSVDWEGQYGDIAYAFYPNKMDQQLMFALIQMLWDRGEANGYAQHMTTDPLPNTPAHQVMLQVAYADHQVSNVAAEVEARTIGARLRWPALGPASPHWSTNPLFGMQRAKYGKGSRNQSVLVYWYSADRGNTVPPTGNIPSSSGGDPHGDPRKDNAASDQVAHFLRAGQLIDVCAGAPCVTTEASRSNG
jgi:hypothetical protein